MEVIRIDQDEFLETRLRDAAINKFKYGETYQMTHDAGMRESLMRQYADFVVELYRKAPEYNKDDILDRYGVNER